MRHIYACLIALLATPAFAQSIPEAPSLTAGPDFKGLQFDWDPAAGASWYELEYRANQSGSFVQLGSDLPAPITSFRYRFPLHLFNWTFARYRLAACNSAGCARSSEVSVSSLRRFAVGYFKADRALIGYRFGSDTDISPDGLNFVASETGNLSSVGGLTEPPGALYVFRRGANGAWIRRARLQPTIPVWIEGSNTMNVAISGDGNTVVLGMPNYWHQEFDPQSGEVFVFRFNGTSWVRTRLLSGNRGTFGKWVAMNDAGDTIAVASGEAVEPAVSSWVFIYKLNNGVWQPVRAFQDQPGDAIGCGDSALSGDGTTVAQTCIERDSAGNVLRRFVRMHSGPNWTVRDDLPMVMSTPSADGYGMFGVTLDGTGDTVAAQIHAFDPPFPAPPTNGPAEVHVFKRSAGVYSKVAELTTGPWRAPANRHFFGFGGLALSGDGGTLAVGDSHDNGLGLGPRAAPLNPGEARTGGIYVFRLSGSWRLANMVKPQRAEDSQTFGRVLALNGNGQTLIVGYPLDASDADGIGGDWNRGGAQSSGAVFMY
jgi:hypothetical protein